MKTGLIVGLVILSLIVIIGAFLLFSSSNSEEEGVVCAQDIKKCSDGSDVGRDPNNNCEFFPCLVINQKNNQTNVTQQNQTQLNIPQTYNIEIIGFAFKQPQLTINVGDSVEWTNKDSASHTVTSDSGNELNSNYLSRDQMYSHTFNQTGIFEYHCKPHPYMKAKIIVQE